MFDKDSMQKLKEKAGLAKADDFTVEHHQHYSDAWTGPEETMHKDYVIKDKDMIKLSFEHIGTSRDYDEERYVSLCINDDKRIKVNLKKGTFQKPGAAKPDCDFDKMADILLDVENCLKNGTLSGKYIDGTYYCDKETDGRATMFDNPQALKEVKNAMDKYIFNTPEHRQILAEKRQKQQEQGRLSMMMRANTHTK